MTDTEFLELVSNPESSTLDFKKEFYDFSNDADGFKTGKFLKDVISFCNTIREQTSYIIFGIKEKEDGSKEKIGIPNVIDDAILQDKLKDKIFPRARFSFYTHNYQSKLFGIIEFPVVKYEMPLTATLKSKGLETGKVYYRQGSMNCEALALDVIRINEWMKSLPSFIETKSLTATMSSFLKRIMEREIQISSLLAELQFVARQNRLEELSDFCNNEIQGFKVNRETDRKLIEVDPDKHKYRVQSVKFSLDDISPNPYRSLSPEQFKFEIEQVDSFFEFQFFFQYPISQIERYLAKTDGFAKIQMKVKDIMPHYQKDVPVYVYIFNSNFKNLYQNIKQKLIDIIMKID